MSRPRFFRYLTGQVTTAKAYDKLNRLQSINSMPSGAGQLPISDGYQYNNANQRVRNTLADGSYWIYRYDSLGQVVSGKRYWSDDVPVAGQQFEYVQDDIGNRSQSKSGGDQNGVNLRVVTYSTNALKHICWYRSGY